MYCKKRDVDWTALGYSKRDLYWLGYIAERKFGYNWKCVCGHDECFEGKTPFSHKCLKCKHEVSVTSNTPFHGLRIPISKAIGILSIMYSHYDNFFYHVAEHEQIENVVKSERRREEKDRRNRFQRGTLRSDGIKYRADTTMVAERLELRQKTVWAFLDRLVKYMEGISPKDIAKPVVNNGEHIFESVNPLWFKGVRYENRDKYGAIFWLFAGSRQYVEGDEPQTIEDIINYLLIMTDNYVDPPAPHN